MKTAIMVFACILLAAAGCGATDEAGTDTADTGVEVCPDCGETLDGGNDHTDEIVAAIEGQMEPEMVFASHILIPFQGCASYAGDVSRESALAQLESVRDSITSGGITFEDAAMRHSSCPSSQNAGFLGSFPRGAMVPAFEDAAFGMEEGGLSEVFETEYGFHIVWRHPTIRASHVLIGYEGSTPSAAITRTREEAEALIGVVQDSLDTGMDFAEAAVTWSDCPSSASGGDLNRFSVNLMDRDFEAVAFALEPGERSGIVETPFGFHLILRTE